MGSGFLGGGETGSCSGLGTTCESPSSGCTGFVDAEVPGANRDDVALVHAPKPPDEGVLKGDGVDVPNEAWTKDDVEPNPGCPKAGVDFVPKLVCPNSEAGLGASFCVFDGERASSWAWFQLENAPKPELMVEEPKVGVEGG